MAKGKSLGGSCIGPPAQIEEMLQLAVEKGVQPWVEERDMEDANKALLEFEEGKPRYRYTLINKKHL